MYNTYSKWQSAPCFGEDDFAPPPSSSLEISQYSFPESNVDRTARLSNQSSSSSRKALAKMSDLATSNVGMSNRIYSEDEILAIQRAMRDSEQLLKEHRRLIAQYKIAVAPHRILPRDVLRCIFALNARERIYLPFQKSNGKPIVPAAVLLTHVCSLWHHIALSSPELWNNVQVSLDIYNHDCTGNFLPYALELLSRACDLPINFKLKMVFHHLNSPDDRSE